MPRISNNWLQQYKIGKGQMKSECIYEIIDFPKYHRKNLTDFCPESLFRLGMFCTHLSRVSLIIIKTNCMHLVYKTFQGRNPSKNLVVFWKINDFINTFWHYLTFSASQMVQNIKVACLHIEVMGLPQPNVWACFCFF